MPVSTRNAIVSEETKQNQQTSRSNRSINAKLDLLDKKMDSLYRDVYISRADNKNNLANTIDAMDSVIDRLQDGDNISVSNMVTLLQRLDKNNNSNTEELINSVGEIFSDNGLIGTLFNNQDIHKHISAENHTYDIILKYLPKLKDALKILRDNTLSADNFSKKFLNAKSAKSNAREKEIFAMNDKKLEEIYDLSNFLEKVYWNTSKYGEEFVYIVPYGEAFKKLITRQQKRRISGNLNSINGYELFGEASRFYPESSKIEIVPEGFINSKEYKSYVDSLDHLIEIDESFDKSFEGHTINLYFNDTRVVQTIVSEYTVAKDVSVQEVKKSLHEAFYDKHEVIREKSLDQLYKDAKLNGDGLTKSSKSAEGLILPGGNELLDADKIDNNFLGAVLERIPRENILPIYIGKKCLGYYHFMFAEDPNACGFCGGHHMTPGIANGTEYSYEMSQDQQELAIRFISARIAQQIDTHFINTNKDLKEEIYAILQYNDKFDMTRTNNIGVTFIPADDMVHCYFELDEITHRGISDLKDAVTPAMLYILLYLTDIIGKLTRSVDKRVYYVRQNVEQNMARTMMNVVKQIKKGNMGMRQIESMNNILNIVGKYNDFIIPKSPNGEAPIEFEIMQGQNIETPTDIMDKMEEMAINTICPLEFVNSILQVDYASRFSMSNTRFMKEVFTRQRATERFFSKIYTNLYNYEFDESINKIEIVLPPPIYLLINNNAQLIDAVTQMADKLVDIYFSNESDDLKAEWKKNYVTRTLSTYIAYDDIMRDFDNAKVDLQAKRNDATEEGEGESENNGW